MPPPERAKLSMRAAMTILGWIVSVLLAYGAVNARVAVLESRVSDTHDRMERIENKVDRILERLK